MTMKYKIKQGDIEIKTVDVYEIAKGVLYFEIDTDRKYFEYTHMSEYSANDDFYEGFFITDEDKEEYDSSIVLFKCEDGVKYYTTVLSQRYGLSGFMVDQTLLSNPTKLECSKEDDYEIK